MSTKLEFDDQGFPIMLAAGQVAVQPAATGVSIKTDTKAGNPWKDPANGQFSNAPVGISVIAGKDDIMPILLNISRRYIQAQIEQLEPTALAAYANGNDATIVLMKNNVRVAAFTVPTEKSDVSAEDLRSMEQGLGIPQDATNDPQAGVATEAQQRMADAARDAARLFDGDPSDEELKKFLANRAKDMSAVDLEAFKERIQVARLDDLSDVLNQQLRQKVDGVLAARKGIKVDAPKQWTQRVFAGLDDNAVVKLLTRLEGRGWDPEDLSKHIIGRIKDGERRSKIDQLWGESTSEGKKEETPKPDDAATD